MVLGLGLVLILVPAGRWFAVSIFDNGLSVIVVVLVLFVVLVGAVVVVGVDCLVRAVVVFIILGLYFLVSTSSVVAIARALIVVISSVVGVDCWPWSGVIFVVVFGGVVGFVGDFDFLALLASVSSNVVGILVVFCGLLSLLSPLLLSSIFCR